MAQPPFNPRVVDWSAIQGTTIQHAGSVAEKLRLLDYRGPHAVDRLTFLLPGPQALPVLCAVLGWLLQQVARGEATGQERNRQLPQLLAAMETEGIRHGIDPEQQRQGHGPDICRLLDTLCDLALQKRGFLCQRPVYQEERMLVKDMPKSDDTRPHASPPSRAEAKTDVPRRAHGREDKDGGRIDSQLRAMLEERRALEAQRRAKRARMAHLKEELRAATGKLDAATQATQELEAAKAAAVAAAAAQAQHSTPAAIMPSPPAHVTTTATVTRMKAALQALREEAAKLEMRIGVILHVLLRAQLRDEKEARRLPGDEGTAAAGAVGGLGFLRGEEEGDEEE